MACAQAYIFPQTALKNTTPLLTVTLPSTPWLLLQAMGHQTQWIALTMDTTPTLHNERSRMRTVPREDDVGTIGLLQSHRDQNLRKDPAHLLERHCGQLLDHVLSYAMQHSTRAPTHCQRAHLHVNDHAQDSGRDPAHHKTTHDHIGQGHPGLPGTRQGDLAVVLIVTDQCIVNGTPEPMSCTALGKLWTTELPMNPYLMMHE